MSAFIEEQPVAVTGIQFMNDEEVKKLMTQIKDPFTEGSYKKVYKLNDEVVTVEVNKKRKKKEEEKTETEFTEKEKDDYKTIMETMHSLGHEHKKYLLLPTKYGYSDEKTRVQILPYCNQNGKDCRDLFDVMTKYSCTYDESTIMTDCVNILKTIHELHKKDIVCMDIKLENTFVNCPDKAFLSLGDTDGFKMGWQKEVKGCAVTQGYYVKRGRGHFITDYFAWLQVFLLVYLLVKKG